jgi:glycosyltransferase involved in cell wall biosynthesis
VCLRVYAQLADGSVHLCFARRLEAGRGEGPAGSNVGASLLATTLTKNRDQIRSFNSGNMAAREPIFLPPFASGRPRRLLLVVRTLQPDDGTLRALDAVRFLTVQNRWVPRLVAAEDGPLHRDFEDAGCPVQLVNPEDYYAATEPAAAETALVALGRAIWWRHLDVVAVFDPAGTWAEKLAHMRGIPTFSDPGDSVAWFAPKLALTSEPGAGFVAPIRGQSHQGAWILLQAAAHLARHHSALLAGRGILVTDVRDTPEEVLFQADLALATTSAISPKASPPTAAAMICPAFAGHPHRQLLSALAAGVPLITTPTPLLSASLGSNEMTVIPPGNPLALAHAMADILANPAAARRRAEAARRIVLARHAPDRQLQRWLELLAETVRG